MDNVKWFEFFKVTKWLSSINDEDLVKQLSWLMLKEKIFANYNKILNYSIWFVIFIFSILLHLFFLWGFDSFYSLKLKVNFSKEVVYFIEFSFLALLLSSFLWLTLFKIKKNILSKEEEMLKRCVEFWGFKRISDYTNWLESLIEIKEQLKGSGYECSFEDKEFVSFARKNFGINNSEIIAKEYKNILYVKNEKELLNSELLRSNKTGKALRL